MFLAFSVKLSMTSAIADISSLAPIFSENKNLVVKVWAHDLKSGWGVGLLGAGEDDEEETVGGGVAEHLLAERLRLPNPLTLLQKSRT